MQTPSRRWRPTPWIAIAVAIVLLTVGIYAGLRSPWGTKHPHVEAGTALRANDENDLVLFQADDDTQLALYTNGLRWEAESTTGQGDPPCLTEPLEEAEVEVGFVWVAGPEGDASAVPAWVKCL